MANLIVLLSTLLAYALSAACFRFFSLSGDLIEWALIVSLFWFAEKKFFSWLLLSLALGFGLMLPLGLAEVTLLLTVVGAYALMPHREIPNSFSFMVLCALSVLGYHLILLLLLSLQHGFYTFRLASFGSMIVSALLTGLVAGLVFPVVGWVREKLNTKKQGQMLQWG
jgi:hypothetical protein